MNLFFDVLISVHLVVGGVFLVIGAFGLVKLPDEMTRLHAPTKATTLGVGGTLIASMLFFWGVQNNVSIHEVLVTLFLFLTAPITAHFIAKAYLHKNQGVKVQTPKVPSNGLGSEKK